MGSRNSEYNYDFWASLLLLGLLVCTCVHKGQSDARKTAMRAQGGVANVHMKSSRALPSPADASYVKKAPMTTAADVNDVKTYGRPGFAEVLGPEGVRDIEVRLTH